MSECSQTKKPRFLIQTLGCKVNQYDSERMRNRLLRSGCLSAHDCKSDDLDLIIVNTCSVTSESDRKGRQLIRKMIRRNPHAKVVVTGCYSERKPHEILNIKGVTDVIPIEDQESWVQHYVESLGWGCHDQDGLWHSNDGIETFEEHTRAFVKIQDGCDLKCTFCSIPESRGRARSRPIPEVVRECETLITQGYPEIVLCGICIGHYGHGCDFSLHDLVKEIALIPGIKRVRISSLEPQDVTDDLYGVMVEHADVVCPHLHLPLQSGANRILRRMKRPYSAEYFLERVNKARELMPHFEISTDIMVGFPGEADQEFNQTLDMVKRCRFNKVHSFRFSVREDTPAARMKEHLSPQTIESRRKILDQLANDTANHVKQGYIGQTMPVLVETKQDSHYTGFTTNYLRTDFPSTTPIKKGEIVMVTIKDLTNGRLHGELI